MAKVKIERGPGEGTSYFIEEQAILGKDNSQANIFIADSKVSRVHARIFKKGNNYFLEDLQSKNGTFLNGKPLTKEENLEPGDYIRLGLTWVSFGEDLEIDKIRNELTAYEILEEISQAGSVGLCFKGNQVGLDRIVTLNLLPPSIARSTPQFTQRFREQARSLAKLSHENIATLLDFESTASFLYLTTEYVEGEPLSSVLAREKSLPLIRAMEIGIAVARALAHAHSKEVLHQDVNSRNVIISGRRVILSGFGVVAVLSEVQEQFSGLISRTEYLSPEQLSKHKVTASSDIYSLGVLLYELCAGCAPFLGETPDEIANCHLYDTPEAVTAYNPDVPAEVESIIYQCLEKEPKHRPQSCEDIAKQLEKVLIRNKIFILQESPHIYTLPVVHHCMLILEKPLLVWVVFPVLSAVLVIFMALLFDKSIF